MCVDFLLRAGAAKDTQDADGWTALMNSACEHHECFGLLLKAGANQDIQGDDGETALSLASRHGQQACIQLLQQADAASADAAMSSPLSDVMEEEGAHGGNYECGSGCRGEDGQQGREEVHTHTQSTHTHTLTRAHTSN